MTSISTLSFNTSTRASLQRLQGEVNDLAQQMNNGGRYSDVGRTLGRLTGSSISARSVGDSLKEQATSNGILDRRLASIEAAMTTMRTGADNLANSVIGVSVGRNWTQIVQDATDGLAQMTAALNTPDQGGYLFGGIQTDKVPIDPVKAADAKSVAAAHFAAFVDAANLAAGRTPAVGETASSLVQKSEMQAYLTTGFDAGGVTYKYTELFDGRTPGYTGGTNAAVSAAYTNWSDNWSNASADTGRSRISQTESVTSLATPTTPPTAR